MTVRELPLPGDVVGAGHTVVASAWLEDGDGVHLLLELLGQTDRSGNYVVVEYDGDGFAAAEHGRFENIVEAVRCYVENGGER